METTAAEQLESIERKIKLATANMTNAVNQLKGGKVVAPSAIDAIFEELNRLNAEKRRLSQPPSSDLQPAAEPLAAIAVSVEDLAEWICVTPRRVQQLEKKGIVYKDARGEYRLRDSIIGYVKEINAKADGKNSKFHQERTKHMEIKRKDAERAYLESMQKLVNDAAYQRAREMKDADIKQKLLAFEKILPQKTGGLSAEAQVPIIRNEIRKLLTALAITERPVGSDRAGGPDIHAAAGSDGQPVGGREPHPQQ